MNHHTGIQANWSPGQEITLLARGDDRLDGPLAHVHIDRRGTVTVIANGRANHAGLGLASVLERTRADEPPLGDADEEGDTDGNTWYLGIEVENDGHDEPYPPEQVGALVAVNAALCRHFHWSANRCIHHREWTSRKHDMSWTGDLRALVRAALEA